MSDSVECLYSEECRAQAVGQAISELLADGHWLEASIRKEVLRAGPRLSEADLEDLRQATFMVVIQQVTENVSRAGQRPAWWEPRSRRKGYIKGVIRCLVRHLLREYWSDRQSLEGLLEREETQDQAAGSPWHRRLHDPRPGPSDIASHRDDLRRLEKHLNHLSDQDRTILRLYEAGLSYRELAEMLDLSTAAVSKRRQRALAYLQQVAG